MVKQPLALKFILLLSLVAVFVFTSSEFPVNARTSEEVQAEIDKQKQELQAVKDGLKSAESKLSNLNKSISSTQGQIPKLKKQIAKLTAEIELNKLQLKFLTEDKKLKDLELEDREIRQGRLISIVYKDWKLKSALQTNLTSSIADELKHREYLQSVLGIEKYSIENLSEEIGKLAEEISGYKEKTSDLQKQNSKLVSQKRKLEQQLASLNWSATSASKQVAGLRSQVTTLQTVIGQLSAEQKAIQQYEAWLLAQASNGGTNGISAGEFRIKGTGRDMYQGHGVGLSQFGAYGAARSGWTAKQIVEFYYAQTSVTVKPGNISVVGHGTMDSNKYAAGLGEVPSKACGTQEQVDNDTKNKYVLDNPDTPWDCWPEEAIKAQVIAARSYAMFYNQSQGRAICTTAVCQVYAGGTAKQWAADETKDMVIISNGATHNGRIINALYSSNNNQGHGTANNDTVFSNQAGVGTPYSYLRARDDSAFSYNYNGLSTWPWQTNGYRLNSIPKDSGGYTKNSIKNLVIHSIINTQLSSSTRSYMAQIARNTMGVDRIEKKVDPADNVSKWFITMTSGTVVKDASFDNAVGKVPAGFTGIGFERGPSQRVNKVVLTGVNGKQSKMAGWLFKATWNYWVYVKRPTGQLDYIYSLTYSK